MSYSFEIQDHASCCGISHLCSFDVEEDDGYDYSSIAVALSDIRPNRLAEITLTDGQMQDMPDLVRDMAAAGFVLVNRFRNSNSGNIVNVFHHVPVREDMQAAPRWTRRVRIENGVVGDDPPAVVAPARTVVFSTFHNIYRDGRVGAGYDTLEHARRVRNGPGRIDRRDIYNDGTTQMVENVQQP